ncbi:MAG: CRTAC1 family protein [Planctomycetaceae bacterium]
MHRFFLIWAVMRIAAVGRGAILLGGALCVGCTGGATDGEKPVDRAATDERTTVNFGDGASDVPLRLHDVTERSGVDAVYHNGREANESTILESLGGGVGLFDYDRDGRLDLFFPGGGSFGSDQSITGLPSSLWRCRGDLAFEEVASTAHIASARYYTHGCALADVDNDGFCDVLVTGYGGLQLFRNQGDGTFVESAAAAGLTDDLWSSSAAWGDFDDDGNLDVYVAHYVNWSFENHPFCESRSAGVRDVCGPREFEPLDDVVYFSNGDGTFRDASDEAGLVPGGKGLGAMTADVDVDGDLDVYVANDTTPNFLYLNRGDGVFDESGLISGTALDDRGVPNGSMGIAVLDFDGDLRPDLWVANYENETFALYRNDGDAGFAHVSERTGVSVLGGLFVGFGTVATDLDLDGDEDLMVTNGHVMYHSTILPGPQQPLVLRNRGNSRFARVTFPSDSYIAQEHWGRGVAAGDLDRDGVADFVFSNVNEPAAVLINATEARGRPFAARLVGTRSNRDGIGARLVLDTTAGKFFRTVCGGGSYLSQSDYAQFWGLPPEAEPRELTITWPSGLVQKIDGATLKRDADLVELTIVERSDR